MEQQEASLQKLGVIHDRVTSVRGTAASIIGYLVSRGGKAQNSAQDIMSLKEDLVETSYETYAETYYETEADEDLPSPKSINLPKIDYERAQSQFITSLQYNGMIDRENRIATAHESTFQWIFQDNQSQDQQSHRVRWSNFREWLETDDQLYWITGKAGSGKSTLMKFLCSPTAGMALKNDAQKMPESDIARERCQCHPFLKRWAGTSRLVIASFYFWNSGMEIQMTHTGLVRSLLFQLVEQCPDIIPMVALKHWEPICLFGHRIERWSTPELFHSLLKAIKILARDSKICLFVDGLDESADGHERLISIFKDLISDNGHVKICVASRPWNIFQAALGQRPSLRLEDLTFSDIKDFVESKFHADTEFENLRRRYPSFADQLMENIVTKASGVFLWVNLVVASLLAGMRLGDRIQDFQRRLDELPPDLEKLFEKILHSLDPFYLVHAAQYFTLMETAKVPLTILQFTFADEESPKSALKMVCGSMTEDEISLRITAMNRRLNSRCKGFLEADRGLQSIQKNEIRRPSQLTVQYLHRTVRDFIKSPKAQKFLQSSTNPDFDPSIQICVAYVMDLKTWKGQQEHLQSPGNCEESLSATNVFLCLRRAADVAEINEGASIDLLDELRTIIKRPEYKQGLAKDVKIPQRLLPTSIFMSAHRLYQVSLDLEESSIHGNFADMIDESFLCFAIANSVVPYVRARVEHGGLVRAKYSGEMLPLLLVALSGDVPEPKMVECLLNAGADPNFKLSEVGLQTPWTVALTKVTLLYTLQSQLGSSAEYFRAEDKWKQTLRLMSSKVPDYTTVPEPLLTSISRRLLQELRDEAESKVQPSPSGSSWLRVWDW